MSIVYLGTAFSAFGMDAVVVKKLVKYSSYEDHIKILSSVFTLRLILGLIATCVAVFFVSRSFSTIGDSKLLIVFFTMILSSFMVFDLLFQSKVLSKYAVKVYLISLTIAASVKVILILLSAPLLSFIYVIVLESALNSALIIIVSRRKFSLFVSFKNLDTKLISGVVKESWPLFIASLSFSLYSNVDMIMIKYYFDNSEVGIYSSAYKLINIWHFLPGIILNSFYPLIVKKFNSNGDYEIIAARLTRLLISAAMVLCVLIVAFSDSIVQLAYGPEFKAAKDVLPFLAVSNIFIFLNSAWCRWLVVESRSAGVLVVNLSIAVLNIFLNFLLIPSLSYTGAAVALTVSFLITYSILAVVDKSYRKHMFAVIFIKRK